MTVLRAACIHGRYEKHMFYSPELPPDDTALRQTREPCPGGQEVTDQEIRQIAGEILDEYAAVQMFAELTGQELTGDTYADALGIVDAALKIRDEAE